MSTTAIESTTSEAESAGPLTAKAVSFARLRPGAQLLTDNKGANDTYFGTIYCDDYEGPAYVKDLVPIQLANELLAAVLGVTAGLPIPRPFLVLVESGLLQTSHGPALPDGTSRLAFASQSTPFQQVARSDQVLAPCGGQEVAASR